ncbi:MAG TPA: hypothetical protein VF450_02970 [Noviherbaspirillum sp.]
MTPTDLVAGAALALLTLGAGWLLALILWLAWESLHGPEMVAWLVYHWRAWRGRA